MLGSFGSLNYKFSGWFSKVEILGLYGMYCWF